MCTYVYSIMYYVGVFPLGELLIFHYVKNIRQKQLKKEQKKNNNNKKKLKKKITMNT